MPAELLLYPGAPKENVSRLIRAYEQMLKAGDVKLEDMLRWTVNPPRLDRPMYVWMLTHDGSPVGEVSLFNVDRIRAEVGVVLTAKCPKWLGASTFIKAFDFAYFKLGVAKIEGYVRVSNSHAVHLAKRFGFRKEGVLRSIAPTVKGRLEDVVVFGMLKDEFYRKWGGRNGRSDHCDCPGVGGIQRLSAVPGREAPGKVPAAVRAGNGDQPRGGQAVQ